LNYVYFFINFVTNHFFINPFLFFSDLAKFDLDSLQVDMRRMDYRVALQVTHNIMVLEIVHRVVVCIFEVSLYYIQFSIPVPRSKCLGALSEAILSPPLDPVDE
jgi:hypothetical protein